MKEKQFKKFNNIVASILVKCYFSITCIVDRADCSCVQVLVHYIYSNSKKKKKEVYVTKQQLLTINLLEYVSI